ANWLCTRHADAWRGQVAGPGRRGPCPAYLGIPSGGDRIETENNAASETVLLLPGERMELCSMSVPQQALKSDLAIEAGATCSLQSLFDRREHTLRDDRFAHQHGVGHHQAHVEVEVVCQANHVVHGELRNRQLVREFT